MLENLLSKFTTDTILGNTPLGYLQSLAILVIGILGVLLLHLIVGRRLKKKSAEHDHVGRWWIANLLFRRILIPLLYLGVLRFALAYLELSQALQLFLKGATAAVIAVIAVRAALFLFETSLRKYAATVGRQEDEKRVKPLLSLISFILWIIAAVFLLDNLGFNISTLVAGLGVSGIAVAIAAQGILGDLFNYFVIFFDRPFELGDFIIFDDKMGSIEAIGVKTTRIRTLSGEQLIVSNSTLVNARVHNYKRMHERRIVFRIGVTYDAGSEKLASIPGIIRSIIEGIDRTRFDRSHFQAYGDFALTFETVYYVLSPDYALYMDIQQEINLKLYTAFEEAGIEFAFPTQTLMLRNESPG